MAKFISNPKISRYKFNYHLNYYQYCYPHINPYHPPSNIIINLVIIPYRNRYFQNPTTKIPNCYFDHYIHYLNYY